MASHAPVRTKNSEAQEGGPVVEKMLDGYEVRTPRVREVPLSKDHAAHHRREWAHVGLVV